ncbi:G-protein coupled receptor Mth2-like [Cloeon dipterum]|uniref:G-protein coupled receptor Mth2-like n=1 Tax=Cloeon dipterum TaxID=197152 RepID=UPI00322058AD
MRVAVLSVLLLCGVAAGKDFCTEELRMNVTDAKLLENGHLLTQEDEYPAGTFWNDEEEETWWVCPCLLGHCIRICNDDFAELIVSRSITRTSYGIINWEKVFDAHQTPLEYFKLVKNAKCKDASAELLTDDEFQILYDGQLVVKSSNETVEIEQYCVKTGILSTYLVRCLEKSLPVERQLYILVLIVSSGCLIWTALAYNYSPVIKSNHGNIVVCHAASLAVFSLALYVVHNHGRFTGQAFGLIFGCLPPYAYLASVCWINCVCIDLYLVFKGLGWTHNNAYLTKMSIYSFCAPLAVVAAVLIFNTADGYGTPTCWIDGPAYEWVFYLGPSLIVILANFYLLYTTYSRGNANPVPTTEESAEAANRTRAEVDMLRNNKQRGLFLTALLGFVFFAKALPYFYYVGHIWYYFLSLTGALQGLLTFCVLMLFTSRS